MTVSYSELKRLALLEGLSLRFENDKYYLKCIDGTNKFNNVYADMQDVVKSMVNYNKIKER